MVCWDGAINKRKKKNWIDKSGYKTNQMQSLQAWHDQAAMPDE